MELEVVHQSDGSPVAALLFEDEKKWQEGFHSVTAREDRYVQQTFMDAGAPKHGY